MNSDELLKVSSAADIIVCGYAFSKTEGSNVRVLDLKKPTMHCLCQPMVKSWRLPWTMWN